MDSAGILHGIENFEETSFQAGLLDLLRCFLKFGRHVSKEPVENLIGMWDLIQFKDFWLLWVGLLRRICYA